MAQLRQNNAASTTAGAITGASGTVSVQAGHGSRFPSPTGGDYFVATIQEGSAYEIVHVTGRSGDVMTITRAREGTAAQSFSSGAAFESRITAGSLTDETPYNKTKMTSGTYSSSGALGTSDSEFFQIAVPTGTRRIALCGTVSLEQQDAATAVDATFDVYLCDSGGGTLSGPVTGAVVKLPVLASGQFTGAGLHGAFETTQTPAGAYLSFRARKSSAAGPVLLHRYAATAVMVAE